MTGQSSKNSAETGRVLRSAGSVAAITMASRLLGYGRDMLFTSFFGTGLYADAYVAAFRLPNILRRLVGEGNVAAAFIPVFEHEAAERTDHDMRRLAETFHAAIALAAVLLTVVGTMLAPILVRRVLIPGNEEAWELTLQLVWITFPYLIFISAAAALMAILNARDRFAAAAFTPVLFNLTLIGSWVLMARVDSPIYVWAVAAVVGGFLQWLSLLPAARRLGMRRLRLDLADPAMRRIGRLMVPGLFGVGIVQINTLVGQWLASFLALGSISSLFYAGRITELPLGVFAIAIATVVLPVMSRHAVAGDHAEMMRMLNFALRQVGLVTLPATVGLIVLRTEIVSVLFERGEFGAESTASTAAALAGYSVGLIGFAGVRIVAPGFYALRNTKTPVKVAAIAMIVNLAGCLILIPFFDHAGIALASALSAYVNVALLLWLLQRRVGNLGTRQLVTSFVRLGVAAVTMGWVIWGLKGMWPVDAAAGFIGRAGILATIIGTGVLTYLAAAVLLRAPEITELRAMRQGKVGPNHAA